MVHQSIHQENHLSEALASVANIGVSKIHQVSQSVHLCEGRAGQPNGRYLETVQLQ